jgi:hypothetical protein
VIVLTDSGPTLDTVFDMESSMVHDDGYESVELVPWWKEGRLTVCRVYWSNTVMDDCQEFYGVLRGILPHGTKVFGCGNRYEDEVDYFFLLGFPCRLVSGAGFENLVDSVACATNKSSFSIDVGYPDVGEDVGKYVEWFQEMVKEFGGNRLFGEPLKAEAGDGDDQVLRLFKDINHMWDVLKKGT